MRSMSLAAQREESRTVLECRAEAAPVEYPAAVSFMEQRVEEICRGEKPEMLWLLEHPALYTAGTSAQTADLLDDRFPVYKTGRGGQYTYHGPGQRVGYVMLDLRRRGNDVRQFVCDLENWLILTLKGFDIEAQRKPGLVGIWVGDAKIAALGVRVRKSITYHGVSLNIDPDLSHFSGIVPCGLRDYGVTSMAALGVNPGQQAVDAALESAFRQVFDVI